MNLLPLIIGAPLAGFVLLAFGHRMPERPAAWIGVGSVAIAALTTAWVALCFLSGAGEPITQT
ncbi:MAG: NADH-quinone oxidoreductase subunit L, partial [Salinisphaera sp.]|nr:NADH-quinone oxidoreductase subunit L [Salinisphaera sp.]